MNQIPFSERLSCTVQEAAAATGLGRSKLYEMLAANAIETVTVGKRRLILVESLKKLVAPPNGKREAA